MNTTLSKEEILRRVSEHRERLSRKGVRALALFGSHATDSAGPDSDLDFLVTLEPKSFDGFMDVKFLLEDLFGRKVDLVLADALKPALRERVLAEAIHAPGL